MFAYSATPDGGRSPRPASPTDTATSSSSEITLSAADQRNIIRLLQCPVCSQILEEPVALPCGSAVCQRCLPNPRARRNITYPKGIARASRISCPISACRRDHAADDCKLDIVVRLAVNGVTYALEKTIIDAEAAQPKVPSLDGSLILVYMLVREGLLKYCEDRVFYLPSSETDGCTAFDDEALEQIRTTTKGYVACRVCMYMLHDPVTTPCGHTFCRLCLEQLPDENRRCPQCGRELLIRPDRCPPNAVLAKMLKSFWPDLTEVRQDEVAKVRRDWQRTQVDEMLMHHHDGVIFPGVRNQILVDKPGYWSKVHAHEEPVPSLLGVVARTREAGDLSRVGTAVHLVYIAPFDSTRLQLVVDGVWRFSVLENYYADGHHRARVRRLHDIGVAEEQEEEAIETSPCSSRLTSRADIDRVPTDFLLRYAVDLIKYNIKARPKWSYHMDKYAMSYDEEDPPADPVKLPWWFANFNVSVSTSDKLELLVCPSVRERLKMCWDWLFDCGLGPPVDSAWLSWSNVRHQRCATL
ncbi:uncharacterized protein B0T15DRAFT_544142 [Chaetomium strumarium]|uniref:RING-type domain-containing protein n=1 Tax=Chaetomium strumarium TaxID=1170767 RepID=A0AAJ0GKL2_9PEZI|nr:hypothetical protein B0T15DRAFT_544142 [Chaetomium strumarium]